MVSLDWETTTAGNVTLVSLELESDDPTHVRVANCLDGPVWPPRRQGVPAAGWDEQGFAGVVDGHRALGYATPADPADPPARIVDQRPPTDEESTTARELVRDLGDARPPRAAVAPLADGSPEADDGLAAGDGSVPVDGSDETTPPPAVEAYLAGVESRLETAKRLAEATSVSEAADAVAAVGGADEVDALCSQLTTDRETLLAIADRCSTLAERAEAVEVPVETLTRLA